MKNSISILLASLLLLTCASVPANAADKDECATSAIIDLSDMSANSNISVSEPMTFTEMVRHYAKNAGITYEEALNMFPSTPATQSARDINYRVFSSVLVTVTEEYKPRLDFYCETAEGGHFQNIVSIYSVQLVRTYNGITKQFSGSVETWLRSSQSIEYLVNGDFLNLGTTTVTSHTDSKVGLDELLSVSYGVDVSVSSNYYAPCYEHGWKKIGAG